MEAKTLNPTQDRLESSLIKMIREVDEAIFITQEKIEKLKKELEENKENLVFLRGKGDAFLQALKEIREEIPEEVPL